MAKGKVGSRRLAARGDARAEKSTVVEKMVPVRKPMIIGLMIAAALTMALAIYQWVELVDAQNGGQTLCSINDTLNCVTVWNSPFAKAIHRATHLPVSGWGLAWAMTALAGAALVFVGLKKQKPLAREVAAVRLVAGVGLVVCGVLFLVTLGLGAFCVTCWGTYALVIAYSAFAWKISSPLAETTKSDLTNGASLAAVLTAGSYLLLLYPGMHTPVEAQSLSNLIENNKAEKSAAAAARTADQKPTGDILADFLISLPPNTQETVAEALAEYRKAPVQSHAGHEVRRLVGEARAPVQILEWSDIRCPHCKEFSAAMVAIEGSSAPGTFAVELRQFPLDSTCNPNVTNMIDPTGVRCLAARALICVEPKAGFREVQAKLFDQQNSLTPEMVLEVAGSAGMSRAELEACMRSPENEARLKDDIAFAMSYHLEGTPLVVINGKEAPSFEPFVYALVLANGDALAQGWNVLPKPPARSQR